MDKFIRTDKKVYTPMEVINNFSHCVLSQNIADLVSHLTDEDLAKNIISFSEVNDVIIFNIDIKSLM